MSNEHNYDGSNYDASTGDFGYGAGYDSASYDNSAAYQSAYGQDAYGQGAYQQGAYPPAGYGPGYAAPMPTNSLSIVALILSLVGLVTGFTAIGGIICGHIARSQIKRTGEAGDGMALWALIVGYVIVGFGALIVLLYIGVVVLAIATG